MPGFIGGSGVQAYAGAMNRSTSPIFSIGHSTRSLEQFLALLDESRIECVVDVRRLPGSRRFPQYDAEPLAGSLAAQAIDYWYLPPLCGRRSRRELEGAAPESFWSNASFARYAAYSRSEAFAHGLRELLERARLQRCALMCSEAVWWRCHRRIITDHLLARGVPVRHIMGPGKVDAASLTQGARIEAGEVVYPPTDQQSDTGKR
ncbi:MAG TPA: DUF488 domain-containing protein [Dokdonella sp.]|uniref:DUF488 domain-containing protein n=1 Tax=Dokdonella sp. TaxID=2291710 RepID=UPI002D7F5A09|nr:DUF488 domain-containing protein [Dokdonella sp.]HET9033327.1 DUF488 domain-containing protein [Dokdonella sp.]